MKRANSEVVTVAWVLAVPGALPGSCATVLPDLATWPVAVEKVHYFVLVRGQVGGTDFPDAPLRRPVMQLDVYASRPDSASRPPWGYAFQAAEAIRECSEVDHPHRGDVVLTLPHGYEPVEIRNVDQVSGPRRAQIPDKASYACVTMDLEIQWTTL